LGHCRIVENQKIICRRSIFLFNPVSSAGIQSTSTNTSASTGGSTDALHFWEKNNNLNKLAPIAQDLICAPASQAFVERVFSLCGILNAGRRSSMIRSLEMRVFLKLNKRVLEQTGFTWWILWTICCPLWIISHQLLQQLILKRLQL
jgi:hypothetical protein